MLTVNKNEPVSNWKAVHKCYFSFEGDGYI